MGTSQRCVANLARQGQIPENLAERMLKRCVENLHENTRQRGQHEEGGTLGYGNNCQGQDIPKDF